ncbi:GtrA family protein [Parvularcula sp. IMCC14364]|uniref:GtrA family protein n=1 Tax=Parvularcula sp. IMCC14364 TaxID=3067902 RepID=UPI002740C4F8|nr:GtrA family protein [Parvularcula sp. IMCC14364]
MTPTADIATPLETGSTDGMKRHLSDLAKSLGAFAMVGIAATLVHYLILMVLMETGLVTSLAAANLLGFGGGLLISYLGNHYFVFDGGRSHVHGFALMVAGYIIVMLLHTGLMIGLTQGQIFTFLQGPVASVGGEALIGLWQWFISIMPAWLSPHLVGDTSLTTSTTIAFIASSGTAAVLTYCWNRFIVFKAA